MTMARLRFLVFVVLVLGPAAAFMSTGDPRLVDLGKLVMILSPAVAGLALNLGAGDRKAARRWIWLAAAAAISLAVSGGALAAAIAVGSTKFPFITGLPEGIGGAMAVSALTSVLEELGWAGGGLALATAALGRRWGVVVLGFVWALWHLVPTYLHVGLFPDLETAPPAMIAAFVVTCLIYRELLTVLRERAGTWLAAAAAHAAPNIVFAGLIAAGMSLQGSAWAFFPAPGGLVFPVLALFAVLGLRAQEAREPPVVG